MAKDPCGFSCQGCLPMLIETVVFITAFFGAIAAIIYPLISG